MKVRTQPREMATKISKLLKKQNPDPQYIKKIFEYVRKDLGIKGKEPQSPKKLPVLLSESELNLFYEMVWKCGNRTHMIMIKILMFTGIRISELANLRVSDIDIEELKCRVEQGKGKKDRYVLLPKAFRGELHQYLLNQEEKNCVYLFETNRKNRFSTRWIREIINKYANKAGIEKRIHPHLFRHQLLTFLTKHGIVDSKIQLISGHQSKDSLSIYQDLSLADVDEEYQRVMQIFPVR